MILYIICSVHWMFLHLLPFISAWQLKTPEIENRLWSDTCIKLFILLTLQITRRNYTAMFTCRVVIQLSSWHLFWRSPISTPFYYYVMLCARSNDVSACSLFVNNIVINNSQKNNLKVRDSKVRNNQFY